MNYCLVIPHYDHLDAFGRFLPRLTALNIPCVVVDDGSPPEVREQLQTVLAEHETVHFICHEYNRGKGAAWLTACYHARTLGFTHVIQIDADGQHDPADVARFIRCSQAHPSSIICGKPVFDDSVPKVRQYGRKITDFWVVLETLSLQIKDSLCGFRVYPLRETEYLIDRYYIGARMDFDTEVLVKAVWAGISLRFIDTRVIYPASSVSHFHYMRDNLVLIRLHVRLLIGMLSHAPWLIAARLRGLARRRGAAGNSS